MITRIGFCLGRKHNIFWCSKSLLFPQMLKMDKKQNSTKNNHHKNFFDVKNANDTPLMSHATAPVKPNLKA